MNAVDLWLVVSAVLFGLALLASLLADNPRVGTRLTVMPFISGGLLAFVVSLLVERN